MFTSTFINHKIIYFMEMMYWIFICWSLLCGYMGFDAVAAFFWLVLAVLSPSIVYFEHRHTKLEQNELIEAEIEDKELRTALLPKTKQINVPPSLHT